MSDNTKMREEFEALKFHERHCNAAETRYWCNQYKLFAQKLLDEQAARTVPEGWRFDRCSDGSINVIKDGAGGANVESSAEIPRRIPEQVLWMLANDLLAAAPEGR